MAGEGLGVGGGWATVFITLADTFRGGLQVVMCTLVKRRTCQPGEALCHVMCCEI